MLLVMCATIFLFLILGMFGYLNSTQNTLKDLSVGLIVLSLGMFGLLKAAMEMFENHRLDKKEN